MISMILGGRGREKCLEFVRNFQNAVSDLNGGFYARGCDITHSFSVGCWWWWWWCQIWIKTAYVFKTASEHTPQTNVVTHAAVWWLVLILLLDYTISLTFSMNMWWACFKTQDFPLYIYTYNIYNHFGVKTVTMGVIIPQAICSFTFP